MALLRMEVNSARHKNKTPLKKTAMMARFHAVNFQNGLNQPNDHIWEDLLMIRLIMT
jgi:hypothetical protein